MIATPQRVGSAATSARDHYLRSLHASVCVDHSLICTLCKSAPQLNNLMDSYSNLTRASWLATIDTLEDQLERARTIPPWAVAVLVLSAICMLAILIIFGFACGLFVQQCIDKEDQRNRLIVGDAAIQEFGLPEVEDPPPPPSPKPLNGKQRVVSPDDMEL